METQNMKRYILNDPIMLTLLVVKLLDERYPDLRKAVPEDLLEAARRGEPWVWGELMMENPELFREPPLNRLEDLAFETLLDSPRPSNEAEPSVPAGSSSSVSSV